MEGEPLRRPLCARQFDVLCRIVLPFHMQEFNWTGLPARAALHPTGLYLALQNVPAEELRDPFMQQTISRLAATETVVHIASADIGYEPPWTAPKGLIFHVGRCGSSAISQALKQHGDVVVYAEPLPINDILAPPHTRPRAELIAALRSLGAAFAAHAGRPYVLKLSSWNTLYCDVLADAFPNTPWVFVLRDPVEVGVAMLDEPPPWFQANDGPGAHITKAVDPNEVSRSPGEFLARLYGAFCDAVARLDRRLGKLVHYETLTTAFGEIVLPHFSISADREQQTRMARSFGGYAKARVTESLAFTPDSAAKQATASSELRQAMDAIARPALERLERFYAA